MTPVYVSIGTNVDRERCIRLAVELLHARFDSLIVSPVYETEAVGFSGDPFYNLAAGFSASESPESLIARFREIENRCGRRRDAPRFSARSLDIDLLLYGDSVVHTEQLCIPRPEILEHEFVLRPLADIAGDVRHPVQGRTIQEIWRTRGRPATAMQVLNLDFGIAEMESAAR